MPNLSRKSNESFKNKAAQGSIAAPTAREFQIKNRQALPAKTSC
jgi:hypothetical protein